ncbi:MAG: penicillin acylase family protein [Gammaproteobacteria bacterium]|nr:penicillin acylase family protein [Gammaproteobacteria bacterium]
MKRWLVGALAALLLATAMIAGAGWWLLRGSLPQIDGRIVAASGGPSAEVRVERDAEGVPTVRGETLDDVAYGLGYVHAQDRYFQMDLSRRLAAGELAALLGDGLIEQDRRARLFRLRAVARRVLADATPAQRLWLEAYTRGVNAGIDSLDVRPWEYLLLRTSPEPWRAEDSVLAVHSMWWFLQYQALIDDIPRQQIAARIEERVAAASREEADARPAAEVLRFLFPRGDEWDTPNFQTLAEQAAANGGEPYAAPAVPSPELLDLRTSRVASQGVGSRESPLPGSNAWAVAGSHARGGAALVAGDMHLGLRVPTTWYRARLQVARGESGSLDLNGVTLPGLGALVAGSNGRVAWSFTNSYGDWSAVQPVDCDPARNVYFTAEGARRFRVYRETLLVAHDDPVVTEVRESPLGVVLRVDPPATDAARMPATCWLARWLISERGATTLAARELQQVTSVEAALQLAPQVGMPHQNLVIGDRDGHIAWSIIGRVPRNGFPALAGTAVEWREAGEVPVIRDPEIGRIWSANARHVEGAAEAVIGNSKAESGMHYDKGVRQRQIRERLLALQQPATPADMLSIQLDDRALLLERWQRLLLGTLDEDAIRNQPKRAELRRLAADWQGRAAVDSVSYRLVRDFRERTRAAVWTMITGALGAGEGSAPYPLFEGSLWRLVSEQPPHLLDARHVDWRSLLLQQADAVIAEAEKSCGQLARCSWGAFNTSAIRHPLSPALGPLGRYLDMPARRLAGDLNMPRVVGPNFGASERFAVSPGREAEGYMQVPGGPSGHPLSPFYRSGYEDWVRGQPRPFLPGSAAHTLIIEPRP